MKTLIKKTIPHARADRHDRLDTVMNLKRRVVLNGRQLNQLRISNQMSPVTLFAPVKSRYRVGAE